MRIRLEKFEAGGHDLFTTGGNCLIPGGQGSPGHSLLTLLGQIVQDTLAKPLLPAPSPGTEAPWGDAGVSGVPGTVALAFTCFQFSEDDKKAFGSTGLTAAAEAIVRLKIEYCPQKKRILTFALGETDLVSNKAFVSIQKNLFEAFCVVLSDQDAKALLAKSDSVKKAQNSKGKLTETEKLLVRTVKKPMTLSWAQAPQEFVTINYGSMKQTFLNAPLPIKNFILLSLLASLPNAPQIQVLGWPENSLSLELVEAFLQNVKTTQYIAISESPEFLMIHAKFKGKITKVT